MRSGAIHGSVTDLPLAFKASNLGFSLHCRNDSSSVSTRIPKRASSKKLMRSTLPLIHAPALDSERSGRPSSERADRRDFAKLLFELCGL